MLNVRDPHSNVQVSQTPVPMLVFAAVARGPVIGFRIASTSHGVALVRVQVCGEDQVLGAKTQD